MAAAVKAIEAVDECVGKAVEAIKEVDGQMFICADHGNAEQLVDYDNRRTIYSSYNKSCTIYSCKCMIHAYKLREGGVLSRYRSDT